MTNVTFTTTKVASDFQSQEQQANFAVGHFAPAFSNTGITVDFQASNIDWTGAIRVSNVVDTNDIVSTTPQVTVLGSDTSFGLTKVSLSGITVSDETSIRAFSLITIAGNTDPQGNIFDVPYANFTLSGCTYPVGNITTTANANFTLSGTTSNAGPNAVSSKFFIDISNAYLGNSQSATATQPLTSLNYVGNYWLAGNSRGNLISSFNFYTTNSSYQFWTDAANIAPINFTQSFGNKIYVGGGRTAFHKLFSFDFANGLISNTVAINAIASVGTPVEAYSNGSVLMIGVDEGINGVMYTTNGNTWSILPGNANANIYLTGTHAIDYYANTWSLFFGDLEFGVGANAYYQISNLASNTLSRVNFNTGRTYYITDAARNGNVLALAGRTNANSQGSGVVLHNTGNTWQQANLTFVPWGISYISGNYYAYGGRYPYIGDTIGAGPGIIARSSNLVSWSNVVSATNQFVDMATDGNTIIAVGYTSGIGNYWASNVNSNVWTNQFNILPRTQTITIPAYDIFPQQTITLDIGNTPTVNFNQITSALQTALTQSNVQEYSISNANVLTSNVDFFQSNVINLGNGWNYNSQKTPTLQLNQDNNMLLFYVGNAYLNYTSVDSITFLSNIANAQGNWVYSNIVGNGLRGAFFNPYNNNVYVLYSNASTGGNYEVVTSKYSNSGWSTSNVSRLSTEYSNPVGVTDDGNTFVTHGTEFVLRIYSKQGNGFTLTQEDYGFYGTPRISGNNLYYFHQRLELVANVVYNWQLLDVWKRTNPNTYSFFSSCNLNTLTSQYVAGKLLPNANTIISLVNVDGNGRPKIRRHDYVSNVWTQTLEQPLNLNTINSGDTFHLTIPVGNSNLLWTTYGPVSSRQPNVANVYQLQSNGGYAYVGTVAGNINFTPVTALSNNLVLTSTNSTGLLHYTFGRQWDYTRFTIDTNMYVGNISNVTISQVSPAYSSANHTTLATSVQQPFTTKSRDLLKYSSNLGTTTYQIPFLYDDIKLNRYIANLSIPGYNYANTGGNTFRLTRTSNGVVALANLIQANITLGDGISNSNSNITRSSYYLGEQLPPNNPPQVIISIDAANYSANLNYNANLKSINYSSILSIPGYTVTDINPGNIAIRSNSNTTVTNITGNVLQTYYQNINTPNISRTSFNNGNTAELPDPDSPTISIDFANTFGYSPDPFVVTLPWASNANVIANTIRNQSLIGGNITGTGPNVNITAVNPGVETQPVITFGGNGSSNLSANNIFFSGGGNTDSIIIANTTYPLPQNANPSQTIVHLLGNYYSDDYKLIRTGATTFGLLNIQSGNYIQPQVTITSNTQAITNITFAPGSNAVFALQDQTIDLGQARALMSNIILLS